jgi:hypothetical protein
VLVAVK